MTSPPITVSLTAAPLPTSVVQGVNVVGTQADASVGVVAPEGLEDPRKSEQEQCMLLASPASHKDTLKSEHAEDSAPGVAGALFAALAHTDAPTLVKAAVRTSSGMFLEEPSC